MGRRNRRHYFSGPVLCGFCSVLSAEGLSRLYFIEFKYYTPSATYLESVYPNPNYQGIIEDINTDVDISTFNKNYVASGFSVGTIINF